MTGADSAVRIQHNPDGTLDEVVVDGGAHLEHMGGNRWFLSMQRADGSEFCIWITGKITNTEERPATENWSARRPA